MSALVKAAIAEEIAKLSRVVSTPEAPFGYGVDLSCVEDLTEDVSEVDPFSRRAIAEAVIRRLTCPRGALPDDPSYGLDIREELNRGTSRSDILSLAGRVRAEVEKDDRIERASVTVTLSPSGDSLSVVLTLTPADPSDSFRLTLAVTSADVVVQEMAA